MAEYITKIRTESGDLQIDYEALANLPKSDSTLSKSGEFADAKATGDNIKSISDNFSSEVETLQGEFNTKMDEISSGLDTLKTEVNTSIDGISSDMETLKSDVDAKLEEFFTQNDSGETVIQTVIQMNDNKISGLGAPETDTDAATKKYVDESNANMTEYVDGKRMYMTVTVASDGWVGDVAPYTQEIATPDVQGILESDTPHWGVVYSGEIANKLLEKSAFALVDDLDTADGKVIFTCFDNKPGIDLLIQIEVNR